jgi:phosphatidate cytidylyltransferase
MNNVVRLSATTLWLLGGVVALLVLASVVGAVMARRPMSDASRKTVENMNARIRAWWGMVAIFALALAMGKLGSILLFGFISFWAFREFVTLAPTHRGDHYTLFWSFFIIIPLQYYLIYIEWYGLFSIMIPVYAFLFVPIRSALSGDCEQFLERASEIQWGLMVCVFCVSHAPALLTLSIPGFEGEGANLLFFLMTVTQLSDVFQYVFGKLFGKRKIAPTVSPNKTWEGFVGGVLTATLLGTGLWWATPFSPWQTACIALTVTLFGFAGGLAMSAVKRDRGVKDFGHLIPGHGGVMDRIDSICFSAPIYFHLIRFFFT